MFYYEAVNLPIKTYEMKPKLYPKFNAANYMNRYKCQNVLLFRLYMNTSTNYD